MRFEKLPFQMFICSGKRERSCYFYNQASQLNFVTNVQWVSDQWVVLNEATTNHSCPPPFFFSLILFTQCANLPWKKINVFHERHKHELTDTLQHSLSDVLCSPTRKSLKWTSYQILYTSGNDKKSLHLS